MYPARRSGLNETQRRDLLLTSTRFLLVFRTAGDKIQNITKSLIRSLNGVLRVKRELNGLDLEGNRQPRCVDEKKHRESSSSDELDRDAERDVYKGGREDLRPAAADFSQCASRRRNSGGNRGLPDPDFRSSRRRNRG